LVNPQSTEKDDKRVWNLKGYFIPFKQTWYFFFCAENKRFTEFIFATGNDLETSEVPLSVLFCIIGKNAYFLM
jgi:hypothetical protein